MCAQLRHVGTRKQALWELVGPWPRLKQAPVGTGRAMRHARAHWDQAMAEYARGPLAPGEQGGVLLGFVGRVSQLVQDCERCKTCSAADPIEPQEWVWWALARKPASRQLLDALVGPHIGRRVRGPAPVPGFTPRPLPYRPRVDRRAQEPDQRLSG